MLSLPDASAPPPIELDSLVDFVADDDRPTFIFDHATTDIVYCNNAFNALIATVPPSSSSPSWPVSLLEAACLGARPAPRTTETLATFVDRSWSRKSIGTSWVTVTCDGPVHNGPSPAVSQQGFGRAPAPDANPLKRQESDTGSTISASTDYSNASSLDFETPFEQLPVDWLLSPKPTPDAWFDSLHSLDWANTTVGPIQSWDPMMRQMFSTILSSEEPRVLLWGNDMLNLYNEHARFVYGDTFPGSLGVPLEQVWGEAVCADLSKMIRSGIKRGKPICQKNHELILARHGFPESLFFDVVFLPIPSPDGHYLGAITEFTEITEKVLQRNRQEISKSLLESFSKVSDLHQLWQTFVETVNHNSRDFSYAIVYTTTENQCTKTFKLEASCNVDSPEQYLPRDIIAAAESANGQVFVLQRSKNTLPLPLAVPVPDVGSVDTAYVLPIIGLDGVRVRAIVVLGLDPRRALSPSIRQFAESIRDMLFKSAALFSLPTEHRESRDVSRALAQQLETMTLKAEESEQNFSRMLRDAPIGMCMHREDGHCVYVNDVCLQLLGMSKVEFYKAAEVGLAWRDAVHEEDFEAVNQIWSSAIEKGTAASAEFRVKAACSEQDVRWLEISAQQRHDKEGNLEYLYVWLRDISSRKQLAEQKLQDALETKRRSEIFIDMYEFHHDEVLLMQAC